MAQTWTVRRLQEWMVEYLTQHSIDSPRVCSDLLLSHVLRCDRMRLYADQQRPATQEELEMLRGLVQRAGRHEPVQFLVGSWSFFGCDLEVKPCTLIPRPSTESLVEAALGRARAMMASRDAGEPMLVADLCTGTGCIAIAVARSLLAAGGRKRQLAWSGPQQDAVQPEGNLHIIASDIDPDAVELARRNVAAHHLERVIDVARGDLDESLVARALEGKLWMILANPPYISDAEWEQVEPNVRNFEPQGALRGGSDGLQFIRRIISSSVRWLAPGGWLLVEFGHSHAAAATALALDAGLTEVTIEKDCDSLDRVLCARR